MKPIEITPADWAELETIDTFVRAGVAFERKAEVEAARADNLARECKRLRRMVHRSGHAADTATDQRNWWAFIALVEFAIGVASVVWRDVVR